MFGDWTKMVEVVPTAVDTEHYKPSGGSPGWGRIVWVGTSSNFQYLKTVERALATVLGRNRERKLVVVSSERPHFDSITEEQVEFVSWSVSREVEALQWSQIGIMPLDDGEWARGKCSYKMLTYLACGLPVVVSPVGMNRDVLGLGRVGLGALSCDEWVEGLEVLLTNPEQAAEMGRDGRRVAESFFSVGRVAMRLAEVLRGVVE
jgi:glycosyltransferase involved in cell wall biosynthesis